MFFGSGNLVFPLVVGKTSQGHFNLGALGIFLTGVLVPFLGVLAMCLFNGCTKTFFGRMGRPAVFWFPLIALSLMGPFGVLARCITVAHAAFKLLVPGTSLWVFSIASCLAIFCCTIQKSRIVPILGTILTPILLVALACIAIFGLSSTNLPPPIDAEAWGSFKNGIFQGYQTMDLLAAFFFSVFVIRHLREKQEGQKTALLPVFFKASLIGAGLLSVIYYVLVLLGAMYATELAQILPEDMLAYVAQRSIGPLAAPIVCCAVVFACLTTSIVLASLFADFLKKEIAKEKISNWAALTITLIITLFISTLEFSGIARILGPILEVIYPALIVLTVLSILHKLWGWTSLRTPIFIAFILKLASPWLARL
ncbi:MAG: hypothetical protein A3D96_01700 [Chlamydiae bacterium RIFCSPHIGHO2_12_FULL_44_59]|nr:MAG: hypothetical protein A2796_05535 [Chlamydiae bacterium RIFCSPHIGHO2_01_FULL_44_39]OGN60881.1 MAG: hypothetical protein A3D96_01700 [Chlamydiae bacterium RIFCSPHIGHO2_12_FULL_44_59]OGN66467.1 MAG: hypothetical protein A2978_01320 [Chlamydiae bacterium RIFCSPLOWO2_01_FULL_44_52]OGN69930.1 MAG: hypothetical protein A3I67_01310 [Chlamydiae bacterium RIFCSPLOWO2_02_FULL_45_22]OGN71078.1 MAG: hypothetical protein A3F79_05385 [Chlamydiae bacterium RIFCSPLOWO2_12_FULL_45_20]